MNRDEVLDYNRDYKLKLATNAELTRIKGYDFLNYLTDLMIKYTDSMNNLSDGLGRENWQVKEHTLTFG